MYTQIELDDIKSVATNSNIDYIKFKNKTILISGGTGLIGSFLCDVFRYRNNKFKDNVKIISLSRRTKENDNTVTYLQCDIVNKITVDEKVDYILHLASNTHPKQYAEDPVGTITTNVMGCYNFT